VLSTLYMTSRLLVRILSPLLALAVMGAACGDDDGGGVREVGAASGSGSASGPASGSGSGSATEAAHDCAPSGTSAATGEHVEVTLDEWTVEPGTSTIAAGTVVFEAINAGDEPHELVIVRGDDPADLPLSEGKVDEEQLPEGAFIGEIEAFPAGERCAASFELEPGRYVLFCNITEQEEHGGHESHFEEGMVTTIEVEA
jgi:hypothetical protein